MCIWILILAINLVMVSKLVWELAVDCLYLHVNSVLAFLCVAQRQHKSQGLTPMPYSDSKRFGLYGLFDFSKPSFLCIIHIHPCIIHLLNN